jgi:hypothetical protein
MIHRPHTSTPRHVLVILAVLVLSGSCASSDPTQEAGSTAAKPTVTEPAPSADPSTATTTTVPPPSEPGALLETELTLDVVYHTPDDRFRGDSGLTDVVAPTEGGPWPTVVAFHGDPLFASKGWHRSDATAIAQHGVVAFLPAWGHTTLPLDPESLGETWDVLVQEVTCAVTFAHAHARDYGGDPDNITLYGLSAGGNAVVMAGLAGAKPLDTCSAPGPAVTPRALIPIDADWVLGGSWDGQLTQNPEAFYSLTPWRYLDGSQNLSITVMVTEDQSLVRNVDPDDESSWLSYRHPDIDLRAQLESMGFLDDGKFGVVESGQYAYQVLIDAGYDTSLVAMPGARHEVWGEEGLRVVIDTVVNTAYGQ